MKKTPTVMGVLMIGLILFLTHCQMMVPGIRFESEPSGAKVYLIPWSVWERDPGILNDDARLAEYRLPRDTPVISSAKEKVYAVVFDLDGKKEWRKLDVMAVKKEDNWVKVVFK